MEYTGNKLPEPGIRHKEQNNAKQSHTDHSSGCLEDCDQKEHRNNDLLAGKGIYTVHALIQIIRISGKILKNPDTHEAKHSVCDPQILIFIFIRQRIHQKYDDQCQTHMEWKLEPRSEGLIQLDPKLKNNPEDRYRDQKIIPPLRHRLDHFLNLAFLIRLVREFLRFFVHL